jgi:hypothetical protein
MHTATRSHAARPRLAVETSPRGFTLCFRNQHGQKRVQLTRQQAAALAERLNRALERSQPARLDQDEERWLDPQIM